MPCQNARIRNLIGHLAHHLVRHGASANFDLGGYPPMTVAGPHPPARRARQRRRQPVRRRSAGRRRRRARRTRDGARGGEAAAAAAAAAAHGRRDRVADRPRSPRGAPCPQLRAPTEPARPSHDSRGHGRGSPGHGGTDSAGAATLPQRGFVASSVALALCASRRHVRPPGTARAGGGGPHPSRPCVAGAGAARRAPVRVR